MKPAPHDSANQKALPALPVLKNMRLERWACHLADDPDTEGLSLLIRPQGLFYRSYKEDILAFARVPAGGKQRGAVQRDAVQRGLACRQAGAVQEFLSVDISREGLYDMLPEGLFHASTPGSSEVDTETSVQRLEQHRREEREARKFFLPLEQEFYRQKIYLEYQEQQVFQALAPGNQAFSFLRKLWNVPPDLPILQKFVFLYLGPHLHRIAGNLSLVQQCFELMLQVPLRITEEYREAVPLTEEDTTRLGDIRLGDRSVLGDTLEDPWPYMLLTLGPVSGEQLLAFLEQAAMDRLIHFLAGYLLTLGTEYEVRLEVRDEDQSFVLAEDVSFAGRLGYTTYLT